MRSFRVEELDLVGERLHYKLVSGTGPAEGWVSLSLKDKPLLQRVGEKAKPDVKDAGDLREGDYYVTLGILFKKLGTDPEKASITKLKRSVGSVVHTTGKVWRGSGGGYWAELDMSSGDSGAGEKSGYVMIDASGFGTPGPCLQKASKEDGPILLLKAKPKPGSEVKAWDDGSLDKEFLVLSKTTIAEVRVILAMLFKIAKVREYHGAVKGWWPTYPGNECRRGRLPKWRRLCLRALGRRAAEARGHEPPGGGREAHRP